MENTLEIYGATYLLFGAIIGYAAASKRGWSPLGGIIGGAFLGILSPLLFFVSGVTRADITKKCPQCAENVKRAAKVCRYSVDAASDGDEIIVYPGTYTSTQDYYVVRMIHSEDSE